MIQLILDLIWPFFLYIFGQNLIEMKTKCKKENPFIGVAWNKSILWGNILQLYENGEKAFEGQFDGLVGLSDKGRRQ